MSNEKTETVVAYKGFDKDFRCRGFQFEVGKTYEHDGDVKACESGFHACEYPLDVFGYYSPAQSRFAQVEQSGKLARHGEDSKIASAKIKVIAELNPAGIIKAAIEYTFSRAKPSNSQHVDGKNEASSATGDCGASSATGDCGASSATGYRGASSATGFQGAAMASGYEGRVMGADGNALFLVERSDDYKIIAVWSGIAGREGIQPNVWYVLKNGKPQEVV